MATNLTNIIVSLLTLTLLEIVLAIDNLVFIAVVSSRLPVHQQKKARHIGLMLAWMTRLILLASAVWLVHLTQPLFTVLGFKVSGRDLFLTLGGLFLLVKATQEIHRELEVSEKIGPKKIFSKFINVVMQIAVLDIVFSFDSILTAVGLTDQYWIMVIAITISILGMIFASESLCRFINAYPTVKILAFSFLIMIGMVLVADGMHFHIPRSYIYFSIAFSIFVEMLNSFYRKRRNK